MQLRLSKLPMTSRLSIQPVPTYEPLQMQKKREMPNPMLRLQLHLTIMHMLHKPTTL
jgi:hypothetical protein